MAQVTLVDATEVLVISVWQRAVPRTIAGQFLLLQTVVLGMVLAAVALITVQQSTEDFRATRGSRVLAVAENLGSTGLVRTQLTDGGIDSWALRAEIARATSLSGAQEVYVVDSSGATVASSEGSPGDPSPSGIPVQQGRSWTGDITIDGRTSIAGQAPVLDDGGRVAGAVLVAERYPSLWARLVDAAPDLLLFLGVAALLGMLGSIAISRLIRRQTRGLEPSDIAGLADHQEALLRGIHEGVVGVNPSGEFTVVNDTAGELLDLSTDAVGTPVAGHGLPSAVEEFVLRPDDSSSTLIVLEGRALVLNRRRALDRGRFVGTVTTFVDRSDLMALESQVAAQTSITETLRAQTHEFDNRLHTVSGLLQLGEYADAVAFVDELSRQRSEISSNVTRVVADPRVAALLVAKTSAAAEAGVELHVEPETHLPRLPAEHAADVLTVLGNLVDNALDATRGHGREISVRMTYDQSRVSVRVADTGPGIDPAHLEEVFVRGWSTKPSDATGRGVGLALVQAICQRGGGSVEATNGDHGAVLTAVVGGSR